MQPFANLAVPSVSFGIAFGLPRSTSLSTKLDAILITCGIVRTVSLDPVVEALVRSSGDLDHDCAVRRVRLVDGRAVTVAAVPGAARHDRHARRSLNAARRAAGHIGRRLLLVPEARLDREPFLSNALLVAGCALAPVAPRDRLALMAALVELGGEMPLADAAEVMRSSPDPVAAVLSMVASRAVDLDVTTMLGPDTLVSACVKRIGR